MNSLVRDCLGKGRGQLIINTHVSQYHMEALGSRNSPIVQFEITPTESHGPSLKKWPVRPALLNLRPRSTVYFISLLFSQPILVSAVSAVRETNEAQTVFLTHGWEYGFECARDLQVSFRFREQLLLLPSTM